MNAEQLNENQLNAESQNITEDEINSAREIRRQEIQRAFNPNKVKVVRKELFASLRDPAVTIRNGNITFNTACINGLEDVVYINLMIDENLGFLAITGCPENDKEAVRWCVSKPDKRKSRRMRCKDFTDMVYDLMKWDKKCRYKILGYKIQYDDAVYYVFDLNVKQVFNEKPKKGEEPLNEAGEPIPVDTRTGYYSDDIASTFAVPMEQHEKETEIKEMDGFVKIAMLTGVKKEEAPEETNKAPPEVNTPLPDGLILPVQENPKET